MFYQRKITAEDAIKCFDLQFKDWRQNYYAQNYTPDRIYQKNKNSKVNAVKLDSETVLKRLQGLYYTDDQGVKKYVSSSGSFRDFFADSGNDAVEKARKRVQIKLINGFINKNADFEKYCSAVLLEIADSMPMSERRLFLGKHTNSKSANEIGKRVEAAEKQIESGRTKLYSALECTMESVDSPVWGLAMIRTMASRRGFPGNIADDVYMMMVSRETGSSVDHTTGALRWPGVIKGTKVPNTAIFDQAADSYHYYSRWIDFDVENEKENAEQQKGRPARGSRPACPKDADYKDLTAKDNGFLILWDLSMGPTQKHLIYWIAGLRKMGISENDGVLTWIDQATWPWYFDYIITATKTNAKWLESERNKYELGKVNIPYVAQDLSNSEALDTPLGASYFWYYYITAAPRILVGRNKKVNKEYTWRKFPNRSSAADRVFQRIGSVYDLSGFRYAGKFMPHTGVRFLVCGYAGKIEQAWKQGAKSSDLVEKNTDHWTKFSEMWTPESEMGVKTSQIKTSVLDSLAMLHNPSKYPQIYSSNKYYRIGSMTGQVYEGPNSFGTPLTIQIQFTPDFKGTDYDEDG